MALRPRLDPRLERRLLDTHAALNDRRPLSPSLVRRLHQDLQVRLTFHCNALEGNTLRLRETQLVIEHGVTIGGHSLREYLEVTNHGFVAVHPFPGGNGRTGRLLLNLLLLQSGYPPALLPGEWRLGYLEALAQADRGRYSPLLNLVARAVEAGLDLYLDASDTTSEDNNRPLAELAADTPYSAAYLALLIRKGRLEGSKRGGRWHSTPQAIARYTAEVAQGVVPRGRPRTRSAAGIG